MNKAKFAKTRKALLAALCAVSITCTGLAAACAPEQSNDEPSSSTTQKEDTQLLKNGNFEFFTVPDKAVHYIKNVTGWSRSGDTSGAMSGIVSTSEASWKNFGADDLRTRLEANYELNSSDPDYEELYVDYNGMRAKDIPYSEPYAASVETDKIKDDDIIGIQGLAGLLGVTDNGSGGYNLGDKPVYKNEDDGDFYFDSEFTSSVRYNVISNPETHYGKFREDGGNSYLGDTRIYVDDNGEYFTDEKHEDRIGNVLMVHNYSNDKYYNGIRQYYSSQTITLEANTAAEISLWVKTSDLKFDKGYSQLNEQDRGAFIEVVQTVGSSTLDAFRISAINTEKIIADNPALDSSIQSNGWLKYTVYVNACDFASSSIQINVGLGGESTQNKLTGYAFFDDVKVEKFISLDDEGCSYSADKATIEEKITIDGEERDSACSLTSEEDDKIFVADRIVRPSNGGKRFSDRFVYRIDLAANDDDRAQSVEFGSNSTVKLTTEKSGGKTYASSSSNGATVHGDIIKGDETGAILPDGLESVDTSDDLLGVYSAEEEIAAWNGNTYFNYLKDELTGSKGISGLGRFGKVGNMLVMLSAAGAPYTATISDGGFTVQSDSYMIVSFWVKTSDMEGSTAATLKMVDRANDETISTFTIDTTTTDMTTDVGENKDIYNGWVQCFFFVENGTDEEKNFDIEFSFGNTNIVGMSDNAYKYGWAAIANLQTLGDITEDVYGYASEGDHAKKFTFTEEGEKDETPFDEAKNKNDLKKGVSVPAAYNGVNGGSTYVGSNAYDADYDKQNSFDGYAGLINRDKTPDAVKEEIIKSFSSAAASWDEVFGDECYQPLIIVNKLREYGERKALNYGFIGSSQSLAESGYYTVSVKVMVSDGAEAYVYLTDPDTREVMTFENQGYSFYYDEAGNVLDKEYDADWSTAEHNAAIVYRIRDDGLYDGVREGDEGKLFANLYNLTKNSKFYAFEHDTFYDEDGQKVDWDDLELGKTYYKDENRTQIADHYLCAGEKRVYEYKDGKYYYRETGAEVNNFADGYKKAAPLGTNAPEYAVKVGPTGGKWVYVNFHIHTGSVAKNYRLELWSGDRSVSGETSAATGAVAFDYSSFTLSESNFNAYGDYVNKLTAAYGKLLAQKNALSRLPKDANLADYEELIGTLLSENVISHSEVDEALFGCDNEYKAIYGAYTLYDSANFVPFNKNNTDGLTGYEYSITDDISAEKLAYFKYYDSELNAYNTFIDYSSVDQTVEMGTEDEDSDDDTGDDATTAASSDGWLLITSIIIVAVLLFVLCAIFVRYLWKRYSKKRGDKQRDKNNYKRRQRYMRRLGLVKTTTEEEPEEAEKPAEGEKPAEEKPAEEAEPAESEKPAEEEKPAEGAEETPAEDAKPEESEAPAESAEQPAEEAPTAEEKPAESDKPAEEEKPAEGAEETPAEEAKPEGDKPDDGASDEE